jgi:hypothetical protein
MQLHTLCWQHYNCCQFRVLQPVDAAIVRCKTSTTALCWPHL